MRKEWAMDYQELERLANADEATVKVVGRDTPYPPVEWQERASKPEPIEEAPLIEERLPASPGDYFAYALHQASEEAKAMQRHAETMLDWLHVIPKGHESYEIFERIAADANEALNRISARIETHGL